MEYSKLIEVYGELDSTAKRLEKTHIISEFIKKVDASHLPVVMLLLEGRIFPSYDQRETGVASRIVLKALNTASGIPAEKIENEWKKTGDLGIVAENLIRGKKQATLHSGSLTVAKVFENLRRLATLGGKGTVERKLQLIAELLTSSKPEEAKYIIRTVLGNMRIGVGEGAMRDAIVWAFFGKEIGFSYDKKENNFDVADREIYNRYAGAVQHAYDVTNDFGPVAKTAKLKGLKGLEELELAVGIPIKVMLALKAETIEEAFETVGKPADVEFKLDGFRIQAHKNENYIRLFTRRLEDVTNQFPDVVDYIKNHVKGNKFIVDSEAVGLDRKTGKYLPFQSISQRIKRKYDIERMSKDFPVELNIFDIVYYNGRSLLNMEFKKRREILEKIVKEEKGKIVLSKMIVTESKKEVEDFFKKSIKAGNEGLMLKALDAPYRPGARVGHMLKFKAIMDTLDLVIVKAEWGEGKRSSWLSSYTLACYDDGEFLEVGKVSTGLKEKKEEGLSFEEMTTLLRPLIQEEKGKEAIVKPKIVLEIGYEEIQKSPTYSSGFALRFPRVIGLREDRKAEDASALELVKKFYEGQKKGGI